jgi:nitrogen fixation protein FixH
MAEISTNKVKKSGNFIPVFIAVFFILLIAIMVNFVYLARHSYPGEITEDAYKQGLQYNRLLEKAADQEKLGWKSDITTSFHNRELTIGFNLLDSNKSPIANAQVEAWFVRPTQAANDTKIALVSDNKGNYNGKILLPLDGRWVMHISATYNGNNYQQVKTLNLQ